MLTQPSGSSDQAGGLRGFVRRHPRLSFLLVFNTLGQAVAFVPVVAQRSYGRELDTELVLVVATLLFLLAPALLITRITCGRGGLCDLLRAVVRFRVGPAWYLLPLLAVPVLTLLGAGRPPSGTTLAAVLAAYVTVYLPALLLQLVTTNWWEETVWTGFFQAPLQRRFGAWRAALVTAPFFTLEHISLTFGGTLAQGVVQLGLILLVSLPVRALMGWIYNRTGSLALVGLTHAAANAAGISLVPHLWHHPGDGILPLLVLGLLALALTRGRLGWTRPATGTADPPAAATALPADAAAPALPAGTSAG